MKNRAAPPPLATGLLHANCFRPGNKRIQHRIITIDQLQLDIRKHTQMFYTTLDGVQAVTAHDFWHWPQVVLSPRRHVLSFGLGSVHLISEPPEKNGINYDCIAA